MTPRVPAPNEPGTPQDPRLPSGPAATASADGAAGEAALDKTLPAEAFAFVPPARDGEPVPVGPEEPVGRGDGWRARGPLVAGLTITLGLLGLVASRPSLLASAQDGLALGASGPEALPLVAFNPTDPFDFSGLDIHPDRLHRAYFAGAFLTSADVSARDSAEAAHLADFRWRLDMYRETYGVDDNFTIRVLDERDGRTLEIHRLAGHAAAYETLGSANWDAVDQARRTATTALRQKWEASGVPRGHIVIRWGRANQTFEARAREERYVEYEIQLARQLGLSLLATEIGTVETFNQDHLVSTAGARSRYQMMPDIMRMFGVEQYALPTARGTTVPVREELHPLLSLEPSMMLVRAYANAVGHELPGISAYHTGPGNLFKLYREFLRAHPSSAGRPGQHVTDAYMWGVTDGFERVRAGSSFGPESRAYVLKAYGALRATERLPVDPAGTLRVERVQVRGGEAVTLAQLLDALAPHEARLKWGRGNESPSLYERFAVINPHLALPPSSAGAVPAAGNVRFTAEAGGKPVRFFLPGGATEVLQRVGLDVFGRVQSFDRDTYRVAPGERTSADRDYDALVADIGRFGFSQTNKRRLDGIFERMQELARQQPESRYRQQQARVIRIHRSVWSTAAFNELAATAATLLSYTPAQLAEQDSLVYAPPITAPAPVRPPMTLPAY